MSRHLVPLQSLTRDNLYSCILIHTVTQHGDNDGDGD